MAASKPTAKLSSGSHFLSHLVWNLRPYRLIWAVSLLTYSTYLLPLDSVCFSSKFIHSLHLIGTLWHALTGTELYLLGSLISLQTGTASTAFVENKLSRSLFSLSPLFTTHPRSLQRTLVRPSMNCYIHFSLVMNSSLRFVSLIWEVSFSPESSSASISLRLHVPASTSPHWQNSLTHYTKSTRSSLFETPNGYRLSSFL